jgi:hypothetical protein
MMTAAGAVGEIAAHEYNEVTSSSERVLQVLGHRSCLVQLAADPNLAVDKGAEEAKADEMSAAAPKRPPAKLERKMSIGARSLESKLSAKETMRRKEASLLLQVIHAPCIKYVSLPS